MTESGKYKLLGGMMALLLFFGLAASQSARAQTGVTLSFNPAEVTATTCGTVDVNVRVNNVVDLTAYHLEITYDRTKVQVIEVVNGGFLTDSETLPGFYEVTNTTDLASDPSGRILWGMAQRGVAGDPDPKSGSGNLITIKLKSLVATGETTTLTIDGVNSMLVDWPDAFEVDFTVGGTSVVTTAGCAPTDIGLTPDSVKEKEIAGTTVGTFSATDGDTPETFTYSFIEDTTYPDNALFTIAGATLKTAVVFDYEEDDSKLIKVRVTDSTGLTFDKEFTISILDINEAPIIDPIEPKTIVVPETLIFKAAATDPEGGTLTWSLEAGAPTGANIDPATGGFSWNTAGVEPGEYSFDVCVSDGVYSVCQTITVTVEPSLDPLPIKIYLPLISR